MKASNNELRRGRHIPLIWVYVPLTLVLLLLAFIIVMQRSWHSRPLQMEHAGRVGPVSESTNPPRSEDTEAPAASLGWAPAPKSSRSAKGPAQGGSDKPAIKWSWLGNSAKNEEVGSWETALEDANNYVAGKDPTQNEALRRYQRVLDAHPPREVELHVKLTMGARMVILYNPGLWERSRSAEAVRWYETMIEDFKDCSNHHDLMVAKIHLGDLYCLEDARAGVNRASALYWSVIEVPEGQILFDDPEYLRYNPDQIEKAQAPMSKRTPIEDVPKTIVDQFNARYREELKQERAHYTTRIRRAAVKALAYKQAEPGFPGVTRQRLLALQGLRPDDKQYQEALSAVIGALDRGQPFSAGSKRMLDYLDVDQSISDIDKPPDNK